MLQHCDSDPLIPTLAAVQLPAECKVKQAVRSVALHAASLSLPLKEISLLHMRMHTHRQKVQHHL
jgi:hypothetical protein